MILLNVALVSFNTNAQDRLSNKNVSEIIKIGVSPETVRHAVSFRYSAYCFVPQYTSPNNSSSSTAQFSKSQPKFALPSAIIPSDSWHSIIVQRMLFFLTWAESLAQ